jgi:hypothetical protein
MHHIYPVPPNTGAKQLQEPPVWWPYLSHHIELAALCELFQTDAERRHNNILEPLRCHPAVCPPQGEIAPKYPEEGIEDLCHVNKMAQK